MRRTLAGLLLASLLLVACGGDDDDSSAESASTTATEAASSTTATTTPTTAPGAPAAGSSPQFLVTTSGCHNEIDFIRFDANRKVAQSKAVVKATSNVQLVSHAVQDDRLLFSSFDCATYTRSVYDISLTDPKAAPRLISATLNAIDADYDLETKSILLLTGPDLTSTADYAVVALDPTSLKPTTRWERPAAWQAANRAPTGMRAMPAGEIMLGVNEGTDSPGKFALVRIGKDGSPTDGVGGDGFLHSFDLSADQAEVAISVKGAAKGLYLCTISQAMAAGPIDTAPGCAGTDPGAGVVSARVAWGSAPAGGANLSLLATGGAAALVEVGPASPPKVVTTSPVDGKFIGATSVVSGKDLFATLPAVTL